MQVRLQSIPDFHEGPAVSESLERHPRHHAQDENPILEEGEMERSCLEGWEHMLNACEGRCSATAMSVDGGVCVRWPIDLSRGCWEMVRGSCWLPLNSTPSLPHPLLPSTRSRLLRSWQDHGSHPLLYWVSHRMQATMHFHNSRLSIASRRGAKSERSGRVHCDHC